MCWWNVLINFVFLFASLNAYREDCFINAGGYICCDRDMVKVMQNVMEEDDNLLHVAKKIQDDAWWRNAKFETVVAYDDFAYKSLFKAGKACKVSRNGMQAIN
uniref:Ground-like domain-containing protein n=1 Tax=Wuchereria bancrofti TaxID=6293 RepID=A0A1I8EKS5_WUCBA